MTGVRAVGHVGRTVEKGNGAVWSWGGGVGGGGGGGGRGWGGGGGSE